MGGGEDPCKCVSGKRQDTGWCANAVLTCLNYSYAHESTTAKVLCIIDKSTREVLCSIPAFLHLEISSCAQSDLAPNFTINTHLIGVDSSAFAHKMTITGA